MGSLTISFILTFNTLLVLAAASFPGWGAPPFKPPPVDAKTFYQCVNFFSLFHKVPFSDFYASNINKTSYTLVLNSTAQNWRCLKSFIPKPLIIFRVNEEKQVTPAIWCARFYNLNVRVRSGGHDYEGLSYISLIKNQQFIVLDLFNLRDVSIDTQSSTAWVQAGATNGELYYKISQASRNLAFPAGLCTSLGIGGHLTGGAYGSMMREFGLGADNVLDVRMVDAWGIVRSKQYGNMPSDLFWALRGGGGGNFGVILAWKLKLVHVPTNVTMFTVVKTRQQKGAAILNRWQYVAPTIDSRLFIRVIMQAIPKITVLSIYQALYLGSKRELVSLMGRKFPELGVTAEQCTEMSWIESVMVIAGFNTSEVTPDYLLQGKPAFEVYNLKAKSDFLRDPMSKSAIERLWDIFEEQGGPTTMIWNPYGGRMDEIAEDATPFPHRKGVICKIQYAASWLNSSAEAQLEMEDWARVIYEFMGAYASKNPREAYVNYRDLDIGKQEGTGSNCSYSEIWGPKYFKGNFRKLVEVKSWIDPYNFFQNEQSIPTIWTQNQCTDVI